MMKIYIKPSAFYLYPYKKGDVPYIEKFLSVFDPYSHRYTAFMYDFDKEDGENYGALKIPKGIGLELLTNAVRDAGIEYVIQDRSNSYPDSRIVDIPMVLEPKNEIQEEAIDFLDKNASKHQAFLTLDVGMGKTYCAIKHLSNSRKAAIIISFNLSYQWLERIQEYTSLKSGSDIVTIVGTKYLEDVIHGIEKPKAAIYITTINTLHELRKTYGCQELQKLADTLKIGIKIFDEAHTKYKMFNTIDMNMQVDETIYLTATPGRSLKAEDKMYSKIYNLVPSYGSWTSKLNNHYIINYIVYDSHSSSESRSKVMTPRGLSSIKYTRYLLDKYFPEIMRICMKYAGPLLKEDPSGKLLIVTDWLQDIQAMYNWFNTNYPEYDVGMYCNIISDKVEKEKQLDKRIIIGTIGSMQNGKDLPNLRMIFPVSQWSSAIVTRQLLGRLRPLSDGRHVYFYDLSDISVPAIMRQRYERNKIYQDRAANSIEEIRYDLDNVK